MNAMTNTDKEELIMLLRKLADSGELVIDNDGHSINISDIGLEDGDIRLYPLA